MGSSSWEEEREGEREGMAWVTWSGESCERGEGERKKRGEGERREREGRRGDERGDVMWKSLTHTNAQ